MKIKNIETNITFELPKKEAQELLTENPTIYKSLSRNKKNKQPLPEKQTKVAHPKYEQNTILPLIWDED